MRGGSFISTGGAARKGGAGRARGSAIWAAAQGWRGSSARAGFGGEGGSGSGGVPRRCWHGKAFNSAAERSAAAAVWLGVERMGVDEPIFSQVQQPEMERHDGVLEVIAEPAVGLDQHVLDDVTGIGAAGQGRVEPELDGPPKRLAVLGEQVVHGRG